MRNLLALGAAALLGFTGIGWYLGWYTFESTPTATGRHISIDVNTPKIKEDVGRGREKLVDILTDDNPSPTTTNTQPLPPLTPAGFQRNGDGSLVFPNTSEPPPFFPTPPGGNPPNLPTPR